MRKNEKKGARYGAHRVLEPLGALPQSAWRLDNRFDLHWDNELVLDVETLSLDAASFRQMEDAVGLDGVATLVRQTVAARGKQHNPVTDSGGMLLGVVASIGSALEEKVPFSVGDRVATLVSLSLTPLVLDEVLAVRQSSAQLDARGKAALFDDAPCARLPTDLPERLTLAVLDVAGAPVQIARRVQAGETVLILGGGGKSGLLCAVEARRRVGPTGRVIALESHPGHADDLRALSLCDEVLSGDALDALGVYRSVLAANSGHEVDLAVCCVNVNGAEMATILPVRERGCAYFFSMSTSFTRAALGAEGVGKDIELVIGNGYARGHAQHALALIRDHPALQALFERRYC